MKIYKPVIHENSKASMICAEDNSFIEKIKTFSYNKKDLA